jgi:hypothetical protein
MPCGATRIPRLRSHATQILPQRANMNPRRVHSLFNKNYHEIDFAKCEWIHVFRDCRVDRDLLTQMLSTLGDTDLLIHVHRKLGDFLPVDKALGFIVDNIGGGLIRIADRTFTNFVIVAPNGVATTWSRRLECSDTAVSE